MGVRGSAVTAGLGALASVAGASLCIDAPAPGLCTCGLGKNLLPAPGAGVVAGAGVDVGAGAEPGVTGPAWKAGEEGGLLAGGANAVGTGAEMIPIDPDEVSTASRDRRTFLTPSGMMALPGGSTGLSILLSGIFSFTVSAIVSKNSFNVGSTGSSLATSPNSTGVSPGVARRSSPTSSGARLQRAGEPTVSTGPTA